MIGKACGWALGGVALMALTSTPGRAAAQAASTSAAAPQEASGASLQEVVVTAQRRTENIQKVPIAVTSFAGAGLAAQHISNTLDLAREVPNMFGTNNVGLGSANEYYLRGLGQSESFPTFESQVSTYVDDVYISRQNANNFALFGVDQIQVLNGPQGTLFGRNSTGGAILVTLTKPKSEFGGDIDLSYGSFNGFTGKLSVDLPINDQLLTRTSVYGITDDGYARDLTTGQKLNATHDVGVREAVTVKPHNLSNVEWDTAIDYQRNDSASLLNFPSSDGSGGVDGDGRIAYSGFSTDGGALAPYLVGQKATLGQGALVQTWGLSSHLRVKLDAGNLDFITAYRGVQQDQAGDYPLDVPGSGEAYDAYPTGDFVIADTLRSSQVSQEVKWSSQLGSRLSYTAGGFFFYESSATNFGEVFNLSSFIGLPSSVYYPFVGVDERLNNDTYSYAGYVQGDYRLTDKLTITVGVRYTDEIKGVKAAPNVAGEGFTTADIQAAGYKTHLAVGETTPRFAIQYQWSPQLMLFASATRGFQGGGWNSLVSSASDFNNFNPETIWSYETGFRFETPDHRLRFNTNLFYENVDHYQLIYDNPTTGQFDTNNAANLEGYGLETSIDWRPIENLTLGVRIGAIRALYFDQVDFISAQQTSCTTTGVNCDNGIVKPNGGLAQPVFTPTLQAVFNASYDINLQPLVITPSVSVQYTGREAVDLAETPVIGIDSSRTLIDANVVFAPRRSAFTFSAGCRNCTMVDYKTTLLLGSAYWNAPGRWEVAMHYKF